MLIDDILPTYHFTEFHEVKIHGAPSDIYGVVRNLSFSDTSVVPLLFRLRGISSTVTGMQQLHHMGFVHLAENPGEEFVFGLVGKFWSLRGSIKGISAKRFSLFDQKGYAKAAWNFSVRSLDTQTAILSTETRIQCTDETSRRRFLPYWLAIRPFSGCIRISILRAVKRRVEQLPDRSSGAP